MGAVATAGDNGGRIWLGHFGLGSLQGMRIASWPRT